MLSTQTARDSTTATEAPPRANAAQTVSAMCATVTALAAIVGVYAFIAETRREREKAAQEAIARIYPLDTEVKRVLSELPGTRSLLRTDPDGKVWNGGKTDGQAINRDKFFFVCSMTGNMFEYYLLIRDNIRDHPKGKEIIAAWDSYIGVVCKQSYGFRGYIQATREVWASEFLKIFDSYTNGLDFPKDLFN